MLKCFAGNALPHQNNERLPFSPGNPLFKHMTHEGGCSLSLHSDSSWPIGPPNSLSSSALCQWFQNVSTAIGADGLLKMVPGRIMHEAGAWIMQLAMRKQLDYHYVLEVVAPNPERPDHGFPCGYGGAPLHGAIWHMVSMSPLTSSPNIMWDRLLLNFWRFDAHRQFSANLIHDVLHGFGHGAMLFSLRHWSISTSYSACHQIPSTNRIYIGPRTVAHAVSICSAARFRNLGYGCAGGLYHAYAHYSELSRSVQVVADWSWPCTSATFAAPCFRHIFEQGYAQMRWLYWQNSTLATSIYQASLPGDYLPAIMKESIPSLHPCGGILKTFSCRDLLSEHARRACIFGMSTAFLVPCTRAIGTRDLMDPSTLIEWCSQYMRSSLYRSSTEHAYWLACVHGSTSESFGSIIDAFNSSRRVPYFCSGLLQDVMQPEERKRQAAYSVCLRSALNRALGWSTLRLWDQFLLDVLD